jgi:hypothetical protein
MQIEAGILISADRLPLNNLLCLFKVPSYVFSAIFHIGKGIGTNKYAQIMFTAPSSRKLSKVLWEPENGINIFIFVFVSCGVRDKIKE